MEEKGRGRRRALKVACRGAPFFFVKEKKGEKGRRWGEEPPGKNSSSLCSSSLSRAVESRGEVVRRRWERQLEEVVRPITLSDEGAFSLFPLLARSRSTEKKNTTFAKLTKDTMAPRGGSPARARDAAPVSRPSDGENKVRHRVLEARATSLGNHPRVRFFHSSSSIASRRRKEKLRARAPSALSRRSLASSACALTQDNVTFFLPNIKTGFIAPFRGSFRWNCGAVVGCRHELSPCRSGCCCELFVGQPRRPST